MASMVVTDIRHAKLPQSPLPTSCSFVHEDLLTMVAKRKAHPIVFLHRPSGIHMLPVELLSRIFVLGSGFDDPYTESPFLLRPDRAYNPPTSSNFQLLMTHVCQHWREVALRTPALWSTLHFREKVHMRRAEAYLARCMASTSTVLDILIDSVSEEDHVPGVTIYKEELDEVFRVVTPHVKRWRAFHLKICDNHCKGLARQYLSTCGPAPQLETLQLYHFEDYRTTHNLYIATHRPPVIVFDNTLPRLVNVSLIGVNLPWEKSPYLKGLRNLELALHPDNIRPTYALWKKILSQSSDLETLRLHYSGPKSSRVDGAWLGDEHVLMLPKLQELVLIDLDPEDVSALVKRLRFPNIESLALDLPDQDFTPLLGVLGRSTIDVDAYKQGRSERPFANLRKLVIHALDCDREGWATFLGSANQIRYLEVDFLRVPVEMWAVFSSRTSGSELLPNLQTLKLSGLSGDRILEGLKTRYERCRGSGECVKLKWVVGWNERCKGIDAVLDRLVEQGYWVSQDQRVRIAFEVFDDEEDEQDEVSTTAEDEDHDLDSAESETDNC